MVTYLFRRPCCWKFSRQDRRTLLLQHLRDLGGGRLTKESAINYDVGVDRIAKPGERVEKSGVFCRVHAADEAQAEAAVARLKAAFLVPRRADGLLRFQAHINRF